MFRRLCLLAGLMMPVPGVAQTPGFRSDVPALRIAPVQRLPAAPRAVRAEFCRHLFAAPRSEAARLVAATGWAVTREAAIGPFTAVSFVGTAEAGTSGSCRLGEGNVGIFRGSEILAIVYAPAPAPGAAAIGSVRPFGPDALRIWDGDFLAQPVADLRLGAQGGLAVVPLAAEERACGGAALVPRIYGRPITEARMMLSRQGWRPEPPPEPRNEEDARVMDMVRAGLTEVEDCSGTGFGFCAFNYRGTAATLSVTTVGDGLAPTVADYAVTCR